MNFEYEQYFKPDRYDKDELLAALDNAQTCVNSLIIGDIEISGNIADAEWVREDVARISEFDREVQSFCSKACAEHCRNVKSCQLSEEVKPYQVELSWLSLDENSVTVGYWGECVNIELRAVFALNDGEWKMTEIYYC